MKRARAGVPAHSDPVRFPTGGRPFWKLRPLPILVALVMIVLPACSRSRWFSPDRSSNGSYGKTYGTREPRDEPKEQETT